MTIYTDICTEFNNERYGIMKIMLFLITVSLLLALGFLVAFIFATKDGQFEDEYTPSVRMLFEDELEANKTETITKSDTKERINN
jgi:cbb3-type cytochrome oxidase maturation protein